MKRYILLSIASLFILSACNSAKKQEAEQKRTQEKMDRLEKDKQQFEQDRQKELK